MMLKTLKISALFFLCACLFVSLSLFALTIFFNNNVNKALIVLGPDISNIYTVPKKAGGYEVTNLDIDILNNKKALITQEKLRPLPVKPELLPMEIIRPKKNVSNKSIKKLNITKKVDKENKSQIVVIKKKTNNNKTDIVGMYRVQFGSFRDLNKAEIAMKKMEKKYIKLLKKIELEIFSYKNNNNLIFHRVWSIPLLKKNGLKLCDQFKLKKIICILQVHD